MQPLAGFRDFYPDDCARRNYILSTWREVARRYGFVEFDGPPVNRSRFTKRRAAGNSSASSSPWARSLILQEAQRAPSDRR